MTTPKTSFLSLNAIVLGLSMLTVSSAWAGDIVLAVEEPAVNSVYSGVANLRGWVVGAAGISRVELYVDGVFATHIPVGGQRSDVGKNYPNYPDSSNAGFSMAFNYSALSVGSHAIRIRAVDLENASRDSSVGFSVTRFDNPYIADPAKISLAGASGTFDSRSLSLKNVTADGKVYDVRLDWRTEAQGFVITQIAAADKPPADNFSGAYHSKVAQTSNSCAFAVTSQTESELKLTQNGSQLSGTESNTLSVAGTVDALGNFSLTSGRQVQNPSASCRGESYFSYRGNFPGQTVAITIQYEYFGSCPYSNCTAGFQGSITKTSSTTHAEDSDRATAGVGNSTPLLELAKEPQELDVR
jgi:hypothetical protein